MPSVKSILNKCKKNPLTCVLVIAIIVAVVVVISRNRNLVAPVPNNLVTVEGFQDDDIQVNSIEQLTPSSDEIIVALFYTDWCGYCKRFKPKFYSLLQKIEEINNNRSEGRVSLKAINCEVHKDICNKNEIRGYPTLKVFRPSTIDANPNGEEDVVTTGNISPDLLTELSL